LEAVGPSSVAINFLNSYNNEIKEKVGRGYQRLLSKHEEENRKWSSEALLTAISDTTPQMRRPEAQDEP
jgi:hypothetical protein